MGKYIAYFYIDNQLMQFDLDLLLNNCVDNYLGESILPVGSKQLFPIKTENKKYYLYGNFSNWKIVCNGSEVGEKVEISHGSYINFSSKKSSYSVLISETANFSIYNNCFEIQKNQNIFIGRAPESNIVIDINDSVSRKHAAIRLDATGNGFVEDLSRKTGVFLNGKRIVSSEIKCGDIIHIMGVSICFMGTFLVVPKNIVINGMKEVKSFNVAQPTDKELEDTYARTPRILKSLDRNKIIIDAPTQPQKSKQQPFILVAGPSATMALGMMASFGVTLANALNGGNISSTITGGVMVISMLLGSLMWPSLLRNYNKRQEIANEKYRVEKYKYYLSEKEAEIRKSYERNCRIWNENLLPAPDKLSQIVFERGRNLWERTFTDEDFLQVRLGIGARLFETEIQHPNKGFTLHDDALIDEAINLANKYKMLENVPISVSLINQRTVGIVGESEKIHNTLRCMILNTVALHSPEDVKICVICNELQVEQVDWIKDLPHCWDSAKTTRYFATNNMEAQRLLNDMDEKIQEREELIDKDAIRTPHTIVVVLDEKIVENIPFYRYLIDSKNNVGISSIFIAEHFNRIPKECTAIIQNEKDICGIYTKNENDNRFVCFKSDEFKLTDAKKISQSMSEIPVKVEKTKLSVPNRVSFLDMYKVGNIENLSIEQKWANNMSDKTLAVPIGIKAGGELFCLDIHEKYHGCHGLVAGMTGSGKSEFLQAFILSALINFSPNEIAFVLVDFKGGDMARPFLKVPHLSATISNLSGNILYRALISLEAEVKSRQKIFNEAASLLGIDKIDINSYHKYFKEGRLTLPLPHLVIVIDEFAQLKSQQPEFMAKLVEIAQVGRSLGIHLILATQKPSGVVDPQIWSNSRFKVCLKVLDKQDSTEMINRPDAALIKSPGRAYVQVGYDEIFEQLQSGYSGADYVEQKEYTDDEDVTIKLMDSAAMPIRSARSVSGNLKSGKTQLEETINKIVEIADEKGLSVKPLWLEPLKETIYLTECVDKLNTDSFENCWDQDLDISTTLGIIDIIETQKQIPLNISLPQSGHIAIYGSSGTGKTTLLQTIVFSLATKYSPELLNIFAFDFGGRNLGNLSLLPHCVNVAFGDEEDKISYMFEQILECIETRKVLFAKNNCATYESYLSTTKNKLPAVLLVLDNYAIFREKMFKNEDDLVRIVANAKAYGIYLIVTGNSKNAIYYKVSEHISNNITLRMNDKMNYRDILNVSIPIEPDNIKGRGLTVFNKKAVEIQAALPLEAENEADRAEKLNKLYTAMSQAYNGTNVASFYSASSTENSKSNISEENSTIKTPVISTRKAPSTLPIVNADDHTIVCGSSVVSGQLQGFEMRNTTNVFIGVNGSEYPNRLLERIINLNNAAFYDICSSSSLEGEFITSVNTESEIHEMLQNLVYEVNDRESELQMLQAANVDDSEVYGYMQKYKRIFLLIRSFSKFYDEISDDDLKLLLTMLKKQRHLGIYILTVDDIESIEPYCDTALYIELIKTEKGVVLGGNISDKQAARLCKQFSEIPVAERNKKLSDNNAFMYNDANWSVIEIN